MKIPTRLRWKIAYPLNRLRSQCWADLVSWALNHNSDMSPLRPRGRECRADALESGACYCGKFQIEQTVSGDAS